MRDEPLCGPANLCSIPGTNAMNESIQQVRLVVASLFHFYYSNCLTLRMFFVACSRSFLRAAVLFWLILRAIPLKFTLRISRYFREFFDSPRFISVCHAWILRWNHSFVCVYFLFRWSKAWSPHFEPNEWKIPGIKWHQFKNRFYHISNMQKLHSQKSTAENEWDRIHVVHIRFLIRWYWLLFSSSSFFYKCKLFYLIASSTPLGWRSKKEKW